MYESISFLVQLLCISGNIVPEIHCYISDPIAVSSKLSFSQPVSLTFCNSSLPPASGSGGGERGSVRISACFGVFSVMIPKS